MFRSFRLRSWLLQISTHSTGHMPARSRQNAILAENISIGTVFVIQRIYPAKNVNQFIPFVTQNAFNCCLLQWDLTFIFRNYTDGTLERQYTQYTGIRIDRMT